MEKRKLRPRELLGALYRNAKSPLGDISAQDKKVLAKVIIANLVSVANGYALVAMGVTRNVGPVTTALLAMLGGRFVYWWVFRPKWKNPWPVWKSALALGVALGVNSVAFQYVLRWVEVQFVQPMTFFITAMLLLRRTAVKDVKAGNYATVLWPLLAVSGMWFLVNDAADGGVDGVFTDAVPQLHVLGWGIPPWALGLGALLTVSASFSFRHRSLEHSKGDRGRVTALAGAPAIAILAVGAWATEGGWEGMTSPAWPYLAACVVTGMIVTRLGGVRLVTAYDDGLRAGATAMLSPLKTLAGTCLGMIVAQTAPGLPGLAGLLVIIVASCGAARYQKRNRGA